MTPALRALAACFVVLIAPAMAAAQAADVSQRLPRVLTVTATPIASFSRSEPERVRFGALEFLGGLVLEADDDRFGGISGIRMLDDNDGFLAITDRGHWLRGRLVLDGRRPVGLENLTIAPMLDGNRSRLAAGASFDTEALALGDEGDVFLGIERVHRIVRYDFGKRNFSSLARNLDVPRGMRNLPRNQGIEGLVFIPHNRPLGGSLVAFSERGLDKAGNIRAFLIGGTTLGEFTVRRTDGFDITDAALIPGGDILILERYFSWLHGIGMRTRLLRLSEIAPGRVVDGPVLMEAANAHQIDNMEGLAVHTNAAGETTLTIVSDENFSRLQRTLLLRFALTED
jgi:hypothetical protein